MASGPKEDLYRLLPSVEAVLQRSDIAELCERRRRGLVVKAVGDELAAIRGKIKIGMLSRERLELDLEILPRSVARRLEAMTAPGFVRVINATGIVVHTNLGRSPLPAAATRRVAELGGRYLNLEYDLATGARGKRDEGVRRLLRLIFPGFDALAVNNNAAAVLLALNTLAEGDEVIISRGHIIEIGESFRINEIQNKSGARMVEVGTTNKTRLQDYAAAISPDTALLLSVHPSNYRVVGFTAQASLEELVDLGGRENLPVLEDWGSGCLVEPGDYGITDEESAAGRLARGPDAICFSGDKLLGGPQAGIVVGRPNLIAGMRSNHLYRALRLDKLILMALEETLRLYLAGRLEEIPTVEMLARNVPALRQRAERITAEVCGGCVEVVDSVARVGGGAAPEVELPSIALAVSPAGCTPDELKRDLRAWKPPIIARVSDDKILLDLRTVFPDEDQDLISALKRLL